MSSESLQILISAIDQNASGTIGKINDSIKKMSGLGDKLKSTGASVAQVGAGVTLATAPFLAFGASAVKASRDINGAMGNVASLGVAQDRVVELKGAVQDLAGETGTSTAVIADGAYQVISAFGDAADTTEKLSIATEAAKAGQATVTDAINLTSAVTKAYGDTSAGAVRDVSDMALQTVALGQTTFPDLASSIGRVTPLTKELGVSQQELFGTMATLTGVTGGAAEVSTQLRGGLQALMAPSKGMAGLMGDLGYASGKAMIADLGLHGSLLKVTEAAAASGVPLQEFIGSIEGQVLALALAGPQSDNYINKLKAMENASGSTAKAFAAQTTGVAEAGSAADKAAAQFQVMQQNVGDGLGPALLSVTSRLTPLVAKISEFAAANPKIVALAGAFVAVMAVIGVVITVVGTVLGAIGTIIGVFGAVFGAVAGFFGFVMPLLSTLATVVSLVAGAIVGAISLPGIAIAALVVGVVAAVAAIIMNWGRIKKFFAGLAASISARMSRVGSAISSMAASASARFSAMSASAKAAGKAIISGFMSAVGGVASAIASIISSVIGGLTGLVAQAFGMGARVVSGIADGIRSGIGKIKGAASAVAGAVAGMLPNSPVPNGPLKILNGQHNTGYKIAEMVAGGIGRGKGLISAQTANAVSPAAVAATSPNNSGGAAPISVSITVNSAGNDGQQVADTLEARLRQLLPNLLAEQRREAVRVSYG